MDSEKLKIGDLAEQTGVLPVTLRAWERRYGLLKPNRTAKGHRLYSASDVARVRDIQRYLQLGLNLADTKALLAGASRTDFEPWTETVLALAQSLNTVALTRTLDSLLKEQPLALFCSNLWQLLSSWPAGPFSEPAKALLESEISQRLAVVSHLQRHRHKQSLALLVGAMPPLWRQMLRAVLSQHHRVVDLGSGDDERQLTLAMATMPEAQIFTGILRQLPANSTPALPGQYALTEAL